MDATEDQDIAAGMRVGILHTELSPYFARCLERLAERHPVQLQIHAWPPHADAPFDLRALDLPGEVHDRRQADEAAILARLRGFDPDALLTCGWVDRGYTWICKTMKREGIPVIAGCDTQYTGSWRQRAAALTAPVHLHRAFDVIWAAGPRQKRLASFLGYPEQRVWEGYYSCDPAQFGAAKRADEPAFLFAGRCVESKGVRVLSEAYAGYRAAVAEQWPLRIAGTGSLEPLLRENGAECLGFAQPRDLPAVMAAASVFVLPSLSEPWGVVVHEAAASGMALLCSDACGAADRFLVPGENGVSVPAGSVDSLREAMLSYHRMERAELAAFSKASRRLSLQNSPEQWADRLYYGVEELRAARGR